MILVGKGRNQSTNKILTKKRGGVLATGPGVAVAEHLTKQLKGLILRKKEGGGPLSSQGSACAPLLPELGSRAGGSSTSVNLI